MIIDDQNITERYIDTLDTNLYQPDLLKPNMTKVTKVKTRTFRADFLTQHLTGELLSSSVGFQKHNFNDKLFEHLNRFFTDRNWWKYNQTIDLLCRLQSIHDHNERDHETLRDDYVPLASDPFWIKDRRFKRRRQTISDIKMNGRRKMVDFELQTFFEYGPRNAVNKQGQ